MSHESDFDYKAFNLSAGIIAATYEKNLDFKHKGLQKITVDLSPHTKETCMWDYKDTEGVFVVFRYFDFEKHFNKSLHERKLEILNTLHNSIMLMCNRYSFDKQPFTDAYKLVIEKKFKHIELLNRPTMNKKRTHKAAVEIDMTKSGAKINVLFTDLNQNPVMRREVFHTQPHYLFINQIVKSGNG